MDDEFPNVYIGVIRNRQCSNGGEKWEIRSYLSFYQVLGGIKEYFIIDSADIKLGEKFLFFHSDFDTASSSYVGAFEDLNVLKTTPSCENNHNMGDVSAHYEIFGGFIFSCKSRGKAFFGCPNLDSYLFHKLSSVPLAKAFCNK
ncbi:hypothetical protein SLE2022_348490 [Rubroshorea leprosula]